MVKKPITVLHLASLEETRTETEKPDSLRCWPRPCLCVESHKNGRLGSRPKSNFEDDHYHKTVKDERVC